MKVLHPAMSRMLTRTYNVKYFVFYWYQTLSDTFLKRLEYTHTQNISIHIRFVNYSSCSSVVHPYSVLSPCPGVKPSLRRFGFGGARPTARSPQTASLVPTAADESRTCGTRALQSTRAAKRAAAVFLFRCSLAAPLASAADSCTLGRHSVP